MMQDNAIHAANNNLCEKGTGETECNIWSETEGLTNLRVPLREVQSALEMNGGSRKRVIRFKDLSPNGITYYYPQEVESKLIYLARMGQRKEILSILNDIYKKNIIENCLSGGETRQFIYEIRGTVIKIADTLIYSGAMEFAELGRQLKAMENSDKIDCFFTMVVEAYMHLCNLVENQKKSHNTCLIEKVLECIGKNYMDDQLSLQKLASEFDVTEKYLSRFFREQTGEYFSAYVERIRMEKAVELLKERRISVTKITGKVGYSNNNTFYKAFKRIYGISPTTFKKKIKVL